MQIVITSYSIHYTKLYDGAEGNLIASVAVFDEEMSFVKGDETRKNAVREYGKPENPLIRDTRNGMIVFAPLRDGNKILGFVELVFTKKYIDEKISGFVRISSLMGLGIILAGLFIVLFLSQGIVRLLEKISGRITGSADHTTLASQRVFSASQSLAQRTAEHAEAMEQMAASLEEIYATIRRNADSAGQASGIMAEINGLIKEANQAMQRNNFV